MTKSISTASFVALFAAACGSPLGTDPYTASLICGDGCNHDPSAGGMGTAFVDPVTGQVEIEVSGLPQLEGEVYEGWLAGGYVFNSPIATGRFNVDENGDGSSSIFLGDITEQTWDTVVLTVEPDPDPDPGPDPRHSIGGPLEVLLDPGS